MGNFSYRVAKYSVTASCANPRPRCPLYDMFTPLKNLRVIGGKVEKQRFECTVFIHNKKYATDSGKATIVDLVQQICSQCQAKRAR